MAAFIRAIACACFPYCCQDHEEDSSSTDPDLRPLLDRDSPIRGMVAPKRTYGKKKGVLNFKAAAIFGTVAEDGSSRSPLNDVTSAIGNLNLKDGLEPPLLVSDSFKESLGLDEPGPAAPKSGKAIARENQKQSIDDGDPGPVVPRSTRARKKIVRATEKHSADDATDNSLQALIDSYKTDCGKALTIREWKDILFIDTQVTKIAEASFGQVYRFTTKGATSIIKIMQLKVPTDKVSMDSEAAVHIDQTVSEMRIMNVLAEVPGFVSFKEAFLVRGVPSTSIIAAYEAYDDTHKNPSLFPHPSSFVAASTFLVIELGDAGNVLDGITFSEIYELWDIFLGIVMALARGEELYEFEHRDLHESNICYKLKTPTEAALLAPGPLKFGRSGFSATLIDYGLSRAKLSGGEVIYNDLDKDLAIFMGRKNHPQFESYRLMRGYILTGRKVSRTKEWHLQETVDAKDVEHGWIALTWAAFNAYNNVIWIRYIFDWLVKRYRKTARDAAGLREFEEEVEELNHRLKPRVSPAEKPFHSAVEVLDYVYSKGWVNEEQVENYGVDISLLSASSVS